MSKKISLTKIFLISMIVFFIISGLLGASFFLFNAFGEIQVRILLTTLVLGTLSLLGLASSKNLESGSYRIIIGIVALLASITAAILVLGYIWEIFDITLNNGRAALISSIICFSIAHATLILGKTRKTATKIAVYSTLVLITIVALMLIYIVLDFENMENLEMFFRILGVVAVLDVVGTIVTPLMRKANE